MELNSTVGQNNSTTNNLGLNPVSLATIPTTVCHNISLNSTINNFGLNAGMNHQNINLNPNKMGQNTSSVTSVGLNTSNCPNSMGINPQPNLNSAINKMGVGQCANFGINVVQCPNPVGINHQNISLNPTINKIGQNATNLGQCAGLNVTQCLNSVGTSQNISLNQTTNNFGLNVGQCASSVGINASVGQCVGMNHHSIGLNSISVNNLGLNTGNVGQCVGQCVGLMPPILCPRTPPQASPSVPLAFVLPPPPILLVGYRDQLTVPTFSKPDSDMERLRNGVRLLKLSG